MLNYKKNETLSIMILKIDVLYRNIDVLYRKHFYVVDLNLWKI